MPVATTEIGELSPELRNVNNVPPSEALETILQHALEQRASDLFFSANAHHYMVAMRALGQIRQVVVTAHDQGQ